MLYEVITNAGIAEVFSTWVLNTMFAKAAVGAETPEAALAQAEAACKRIWDKWKERGMM